jgi:zinc protease
MTTRVERRTLDNGLTVVAERRGLGPVVFSGVVYGVGSRDERPGMTGISHLLEHMMFKGTEKYGKGEVAALVERNGGELNAFTSEDVTMYYEVFARDRWELALEIEAERMVNLRLDAAELESERQVVLEERAMYLDIPSVELGEELLAAAFRESPYRWPIIGWESDIRSMSRDDLAAHYERWYTPGNASLVVVGDVDPDGVFAAAERRFGGIAPRTVPARRIPREPELKGRVHLALERTTALPHLQILFRAPELRTRDSEALAMLANVLSGSRTSRLDLALLETNRAGDVQVHYHPKHDPSPFTVIVEGHPDVPLDEVEDILWREIEAVAARDVDPDELDRARNQVEAHQLFAMQSPSNRGFSLGWHEAHGDVGYVDRVIDNLRTLTAADLREAAARHLRRERSALARIEGGNGAGPARPGATSGAPPTASLLWPGVEDRRHRSGLASAPAVRRLALANGMKVVLQPDRTDPVVAVSLLFEGGSALDPPGREGLASLSADTMERGPRDREFVEYSRGFERLGSQLSIAAGAELVHCDVTLLARHAGAGLSLVADLLEAPGLRENDLDVVRNLALNDLEAREDDLDDVAEDLLLRGVADEHAYARLPHGTAEGVSAVTIEDVRRFQPEAYRPDRAYLAVVGDVDEEALGRILEERFARLPAPAASRAPMPPLAGPTAARTLVRTRNEKTQAKICFGGPGLSASDPDRFAAIALNHVLGGSSIRSRLGDEIRDRAGLAYSVGSRLYERSVGGFFLVSLGTRPENVRRAVDSVRAEVARIAEGVTEAELRDARDYLTGSFPLRFTTYGRLARFWTRSTFYGWPEDYLQRYADRVRSLEPADLRRAGRRLADSARVLAVCGPVDDRLEPSGDAAGNG